MIPFPHQERADRAIDRAWADHRRVLLVMATGAGKSFVAARQILKCSRPALVLTHLDTLVKQTARALRAQGLQVDIEQGRSRALYSTMFGSPMAVVASVSTLARPDRLAVYPPGTFDLIWADEAHHSVSPSWRRIIDHFGGARVLGTTATPIRADSLQLGSIYTGLACWCPGADDGVHLSPCRPAYSLRDAIRDGVCVPIFQERVVVEHVSFGHLRARASDLTEREREEVMLAERALHGVAKDVLSQPPHKTIVFCASQRHAVRMAEIMNRYRSGCARAITFETDEDDAETIKAEFSAGRFDYLCNYAVLTEGYDEPYVDQIVIARHTKNVLVYEQMVGRGARRAEGKDECVVRDYADASGRHRFCNVADVLGGIDPELASRAARVAAKERRPVHEAVEACEADPELGVAKRRGIVATSVRVRREEVDPFGDLALEDRESARESEPAASEEQLARLRQWKLLPDEPITSREAQKLIRRQLGRFRKGLCSLAQGAILGRLGYAWEELTRDEARVLLDKLAANGFRRLG